MSVATGTKLGPYVVADQLGVGGMGEVYRATDTRLERQVAIKVLPDRVAGDGEALRRFQREAKAVSRLNHPHVCTLHDVGEQDGIHYLVMELVEGETLSRRLARGWLPVDQALHVAGQIADALATAHRAGIVHRDLKPGNVMLTKSGVKVLDFGLAKLDRAAGGSSSGVVRSTVARDVGLGHEFRQAATFPSVPVTAEGAILGTLHYMAPEQLEGRSVDARADFFALGVILYEMVTGTRPFGGESEASLIASILRDEPPPMNEREALTPSTLDRVVCRCLAKDPEERWQSAADLGAALSWAADEGGTVSGERGRRSGRAPILVGALGLLLLSAYLGSKLIHATSSEAPPAPVVRYTVDLPRGVGFGCSRVVQYGRPYVPSVAISPDAEAIFFVGQDEGEEESRVFRYSLQTNATAEVPNSHRATVPLVARDGNSLYFGTGTEVRIASLRDGSVRSLGAFDRRGQLTSACLGADRMIFPWSNGGLASVALTGGAPTTVTTNADDDSSAQVFPQWLPGERAVLYNEIRGDRPSGWRVVAEDLDTHERTVVVEGASAPLYVASGHVLFARTGRLWAVPFDAERLKVTGEAVVVLDDVMHAENAGNDAWERGSAQYAVSRTGTLVHVAGGVYPTPRQSLAWVDREGTRTEIPLPISGDVGSVRVSPDGTRVACVLSESRYTRKIWILDVGRGLFTPLNVALDRPSWLAWSPDGKELIVNDELNGGSVTRIALDGSAPPHHLPFSGIVASWSVNGVVALVEDGEIETWAIDAGGEPERLFDTPGYSVAYPEFSPDGEWLAYRSYETGRSEVFVRPASGRPPAVRVSADGGSQPVWSRDGKRLYFLAGRMRVVDISIDDERLSVGEERSLWDWSPYGSTVPVRSHDLSPIDERFIAPLDPDPDPSASVATLHVTLNWFEELRRRAPTWER